MKIEIETRFLDIDKAGLIEKLKKLGAIDMGEKTLNEIIFYDKKLEWIEAHRFIRIRKINDSIILTYKHNKYQSIDGANEIEFGITDMNEAKIFLEIMDLIAYRTQVKKRHTFKLDGVTIDIDTWPRIPVYVELEGNSVEDLRKVAQKLEFDWEARFDKDARYIYMKYGFDFDKLRVVTFERFE